VSRVPAPEIEQAILSALRKHIAEQRPPTSDRDDPVKFDHDSLATLVSRIEVQRTQLIMSLKPTDRSTEAATLSIPWQKPPSKRFRKILLPQGALRENVRPDRAERRLRLINAVARGRRWLDEIVSGSITGRRATGKARTMHGTANQSEAIARAPCSAVGQSSRRRAPTARHQYRAPARSRPELG